MKKSRLYRRVPVCVARFRGGRLTLAADLRDELDARLRSEVETLARPAAKRPNVGVAADERAFLRSVALERLADFQLLTGSPVRALGTLCDAALEALCGEQYDHGSESLPARFLRIRFYALLARIHSCRRADPRLGAFPLDSRLLRDAARLGGSYL